MIDVFETWFNQFSKAEQERLIKHIMKNHAMASSNDIASNPEKNDKKKGDHSSNLTSRSLHQFKSAIEI